MTKDNEKDAIVMEDKNEVNFIGSKLDSMPEFLTTNDLVALGLYRNIDGTYLARIRGTSPDYIKVGRKILFPKSKVIEFLRARIQDGSKSRKNEPVV